jgi:hypothetical protein
MPQKGIAMNISTRTAFAILFSLASLGFAQSAPTALGPAEQPRRGVMPPVSALALRGIAPVVTLPSVVEAQPAEVEALIEWNRSGRVPSRLGFARLLPQAIHFGESESDSISGLQPYRMSVAGQTVLTAAISVRDSYRFRLHLTNVTLSPGVVFWISGQQGEPIEFDLSLQSPAGDLWTPSVWGDTAYLEVVLTEPSDVSQRFDIAEIAEVLGPALADSLPVTTGLECLEDATCITPVTFSAVDQVRSASAHLEFMAGNSLQGCTGTLLNNTAGSFAAYLLTANHCISTQDEAASLDTFWDYRTAVCNGPAPNPSGIPRTHGATLLAHGSSSDYSFLQLPNSGGQRYYLGWDSRGSTIVDGLSLYRISYPIQNGIPLTQKFSSSTVTLGGVTCVGEPRPQFIYSIRALAGTGPGASGSAIVTADGHVVGQLWGGCTLPPGDPTNLCADATHQVDGTFAATYPSIVQWLDPPSPSAPVAAFSFSPTNPVVGQTVSFTDSSTGTPTSWSWTFGDGTTSTTRNPTKAYSASGTYTVTLTASNAAGSNSVSHAVPVSLSSSCHPGPTALCLNGGRFSVTADWQRNNGTSGHGQAIPLVSDTGAFWFFASTNYEMLIKVLDACALTGHKWVFAGGLTNVKVTVRVTDTQTGVTNTYINPQGQAFSPIQDTSAFATCP